MEHPTIWFVLDAQDNRLAQVIKHTEQEAKDAAYRIYGNRVASVIDSGKKKPPSTCCDKCGDKPCS